MLETPSIQTSLPPPLGGGLSFPFPPEEETTPPATNPDGVDADHKGKRSVLQNRWYGTGASLPGMRKRRAKRACQDSHALIPVKDDSGIMLVCDGAGSAPYSHLGASALCEEGMQMLVEPALKDLLDSPTPPAASDWEKTARNLFTRLAVYLEFLAEQNDLSSTALATTCLLVAFRREYALGAFVGDGRGAYRLAGQCEWQALFVPYKGTFANETVFLTSAPWPEAASQHLQTLIIDQPVDGLTLMSDGMENHCFNCNVRDEKGCFHDPNTPHAGAFQNWAGCLENAQTENYDQERLAETWEYYVREGSARIEKEPDDKTIAMAICTPEEVIA